MKFRVWDVLNERYVDPNEFLLGLDGKIFKKGYDNFNSHLGYELDLVYGCEYEIEQYTGMKDKNGREICEGDKVSLDKEEHIVHYNSETLSFDLKDFDEINQCPLYYFSECEVSGNIHEEQ